MKLREYENRFRDGKISGAIMYIPGYMTKPMAFRYYSGNYAWFVDIETYPGGKMTLVEMSANELLNMEVIDYVIPKNPLMEGDYVYIGKEKQRVERIKEGDGSPYPIITEQGQYRWDEIKMVVRNQ